MGTIYHSGTIITMQEVSAGTGAPGPSPESVLTVDDRIIATGTLEDIRDAHGDGHELVDLEGNVLLPAFVDAHSHFTTYGVFASQVNLRLARSVDDIVVALSEKLAARAEDDTTPLAGVAYDHNNLPGDRHPDRHDLDRVSDSVPIFIIHQSSHMGVANSAALRTAGIDASTPDPDGGRFGRESGTSEPDGYVEELSALMIFAQGFADGAGTSLLLPGTQADPREAIRTAQREYLSRGITTVQEGAAAPHEVDSLIAAGADGDLVLDVVAYPIVTAGGLDVLDAHPDHVGGYVVAAANSFWTGHRRRARRGCPSPTSPSPMSRSQGRRSTVRASVSAATRPFPTTRSPDTSPGRWRAATRSWRTATATPPPSNSSPPTPRSPRPTHRPRSCDPS